MSAAPAIALNVDVPTTLDGPGRSAPPAGAAGPAPAPAVAAPPIAAPAANAPAATGGGGAPALTAPALAWRVSGLRPLAPGMVGPAVGALQRALRTRGFGLAVDAAYGPATERAVRRVQLEMHMRATGRASVALLRRLGLRARPALAVSATPVPLGPAPSLSESRALSPGMVGPDVMALQRVLRARGLRVVVDGDYGPATVRAVQRVQRGMHMRPTGRASVALLHRLGLRNRLAAAVRTTPAPTPAGAASARYLKAFPVQGPHAYSDDFGAPRHQGTHEGIDILSPRGTPVVAVADGTVDRLTRVETGLGGIWIWLRDGAGNTYYYAHLSAIAPGLVVGSQVTAGQRIGAVGNSGDARWGATHLHFEIHPGDGAAVDGYADLRAVDPAVGGQLAAQIGR